MRITVLLQSRCSVVCLSASRSWHDNGPLHHVITQPNSTDNSAAFRCAVSVSMPAAAAVCPALVAEQAGRGGARFRSRSRASMCSKTWACLSPASDITLFKARALPASAVARWAACSAPSRGLLCSVRLATCPTAPLSVLSACHGHSIFKSRGPIGKHYISLLQ